MNKLFSVDVLVDSKDRQTLKILAISAAEAQVLASFLDGVVSVEACREVKQPSQEELQRLAAKNICDAFAHEGYTAVSAAVEKASSLLPASATDSSEEKMLRALCSSFKANGFLGFGSVAQTANRLLSPSIA